MPGSLSTLEQGSLCRVIEGGWIDTSRMNPLKFRSQTPQNRIEIEQDPLFSAEIESTLKAVGCEARSAGVTARAGTFASGKLEERS